MVSCSNDAMYVCYEREKKLDELELLYMAKRILLKERLNRIFRFMKRQNEIKKLNKQLRNFKPTIR